MSFNHLTILLSSAVVIPNVLFYCDEIISIVMTSTSHHTTINIIAIVMINFDFNICACICSAIPYILVHVVVVNAAIIHHVFS